MFATSSFRPSLRAPGQSCLHGVVLDHLEMPVPGERGQVDVCKAANFHAIEGQASDQVSHSRLVFEIRLTEVARVPIEPDPEFCSAFGGGEYDVDISPVDTPLEDNGAHLGTQPQRVTRIL
jgi:hypothetical protein